MFNFALLSHHFNLHMRISSNFLEHKYLNTNPKVASFHHLMILSYKAPNREETKFHTKIFKKRDKFYGKNS